MRNRWHCEVVKKNGKYSANMFIGGNRVEGLPEEVDYTTLYNAIRQKTGICILKHKDMIWFTVDGVVRAIIDCTQHKPNTDCRVTASEYRNNWKPNYSQMVKGFKVLAIRVVGTEVYYDIAIFGENSMVVADMQCAEEIRENVSYEGKKAIEQEYGDELKHNFINDALIIL